MGAGRSGTSLLAGMISRVGYHAGAELYEPRDSNPKGFFEDAEINSINERLLEPVVPELEAGHRWLAEIATGTPVPAPGPELESEIAWHCAQAPFCYKDPRFCYTLDAWRPHVGDAALLCVFRAPLVTARSIVREIAGQEYLAPLRGQVTEEHALAIWTAMYRWVIERQATDGEWLFVHYDQLLDGSGTVPLEQLLGVRVDHQFADPALDRTRASADAPGETAAVYRELCRLAAYADPVAR